MLLLTAIGRRRAAFGVAGESSRREVRAGIVREARGEGNGQARDLEQPQRPVWGTEVRG
ncbi:MAG: hypothetical protein HYV63_33525 [Candidatus Schekmanbacteria bacterium]|nr:hypothetical protein [Candidatus Schekmanbacteria bacterium]